AALAWLKQPWFHAVCGNHDDFAVRYRSGDIENWVMNGGAWFQLLSEAQQEAVSKAFATLPCAIEVQTAGGAGGIVHADCETDDWRDLDRALSRRSVRDACMWSRERITSGDSRGIAGI